MEHSTLFLYFYIYAFIGWICESVYKSVGKRKLINSGFLHSPVCPVYGFGAIIVIYMLKDFINQPILLFIFAIITTSILEYITSWGMEKIFHMKWWDYSTYPFNINGRVCLKNSLMFGVLGVVVMYVVHPAVRDFLNDISLHTQTLIAAVLFVVLIVDTTMTTMQTLNLSKIHTSLEEGKDKLLESLEAKGKDMEELFARMEKRQLRLKKRFPNLQAFHADTKEKMLELYKNKKR